MAAVDNSKALSDRDITEAAAYKRLYPVEYLRRFVIENVRPDGRNKDQAREVKINVGMFFDGTGSRTTANMVHSVTRCRVHG
jgi:exosome complex RNA-binding protein Rrp42 (RNase PH superfamily)